MKYMHVHAAVVSGTRSLVFLFYFYQFSQKTRYVQEDKPIGVQPEQLSTKQKQQKQLNSTKYRTVTKDK